MSDIDNQVRQVLDTYRSAVLAKNVETLMHLYAADARVFDAWGTWSYDGAAAWRVAVEGWFASLGSDTCTVTFDGVQVVGDTSVAAVSAIVTYAARSAHGQALRAMDNRISWVFKTSGHVLRIAHEHTSAPIGFDDQKALLQRNTGA